MNRLMANFVKYFILLFVFIITNATNAGPIVWQKDSSALEAEYNLEYNASFKKPIIAPVGDDNIDGVIDDLTDTKVTPLIQELEALYGQYRVKPEISATVESKPEQVAEELADEGIDILGLEQAKKTQLKKLYEGRISIHQAIEMGLSYQYKIKAVALDLDRITLLEKVAKSQWYPQINYKHSHNLKEAFGQVKLDSNGALTNEDRITTKYQSGFNFKQNLNFNKLRLDDAKSKLNTEAGGYKLTEEKQNLGIAIASLFLDSLHFSDKVDIARKYQKTVQELTDLVTLRYDAGRITLLEKKKLELNVELTLAEQSHFQTQLNNASAFLSRAIGVENLDGSELVPVELGVENFDKYRQILKSFVKENVVYLQSFNQLKQAKNEEKLLKTAFYPLVEINGAIEQNKAIVGEDYTSSKLLLDVNYSLWTGGADTSKLKSSRIGIKASKNRLNAIQEEIFDVIEKSFTQYEQSTKQYKTYYKNRLVSWDLFNIQYEAFKIGKKVNLIELVSSLTNWYNNYLKAQKYYYDALNNKNIFYVSSGQFI